MIQEKDRQYLLKLARRTIEDYVNGKQPQEPKDYSKQLEEKCGVFCTLHKKDKLRGCVGLPYPTMPLIKAIQEAAVSATEDSRFPTLRKNELSEIKIEISVLTKPELIEVKHPDEYLQKIIPHKDGLILEYGHYSGLFLPQVWEQLPDKKQFLDHLCIKAGLAPGSWQMYPVKIYRFHVQVFEEESNIQKKHKTKEFFGLMPEWKTSTQKLKNEAREGW